MAGKLDFGLDEESWEDRPVREAKDIDVSHHSNKIAKELNAAAKNNNRLISVVQRLSTFIVVVLMIAAVCGVLFWGYSVIMGR